MGGPTASDADVGLCDVTDGVLCVDLLSADRSVVVCVGAGTDDVVCIEVVCCGVVVDSATTDTALSCISLFVVNVTVSVSLVNAVATVG